MGLDAYPIGRFGGLNLISDPEEVGHTGAIDMQNIDLQTGGVIRTRDGITDFSTATDQLATRPQDIIAANLGADMLVAVGVGGGGDVRLSKISTAGAVTNVGQINPNAELSSLALIATPASELMFIATRGNVQVGHSLGAAQLLKKFDGAAIAASVGSPRFIDVTSSSNRLMQAGFASAATSPTGANGSAYTVFWSDPGLPETYSANNFVHFNPGDGYPIEAIKTWGAFTFIFKSNCFYVVYGESTGGTGDPIFNYRRVDFDGFLHRSPYTMSVADGVDGVYFVTTRGVYRTTGGPGQLVSQEISPVFTDQDNIFHIEQLHSLSVSKGRLHFQFETPTTEEDFVYDPVTGHWMRWRLPLHVSRMVDWQVSQSKQGSEEKIFFLLGNKVVFFDEAVATDSSVAMPAYYQSGFYQPSVGNEVSIRWTKLWGTGAPTFNIYTNHETSDPLSRGGTVTLGTSPQVAKGYHLKAYTGDLLSYKISSTSGAWSVNRVEHDVTQVVTIQ